MSERTQILNKPAIALVLLQIGFSVGLMLVLDTVKSLQAEVSTLRGSLAENTQSPGDFQRAVADSLEALAAKKREELRLAKFAPYQAASEAVPDGKSIYGNLQARFTLIEFSDLECPFCKRFHDTPKQIVDNSKGAINWQWKHLPLSFHNPAAKVGAEAAECVRHEVGNRAFWVFLDEFFAQTNGNGRGVSDLAGIAAVAGMNPGELHECMQEGRYSHIVDGDLNLAASQGITGTPTTILVDNHTGRTQMLSGAQSAQAITSVILRMIETTPASEARAEADED